MPLDRDYQEITILIPGYSIEDLPTDLNERGAASLLNAFAVAWHPQLLARSTDIPQYRQAESNDLPTGQQVVIVPECSEDWLGHDWQDQLSDTLSVALSGCSDRSEWLAAVDEKFPAESEVPADLLAAFLSLGVHHLVVSLLSRRMHHYVDPDTYLLKSEAQSAADAALVGDVDKANDHLRRCFECLQECREQFYPVDSYLVDMCLPSEQTTGDELQTLISDTAPLTLICSGRELQAHCETSPSLQQVIAAAVQDGRLALMTGHQHELRTSLGSLSTLYSDIKSALDGLRPVLKDTAPHWARRRFGLTSSLPTILSHFEFQSALHVVLDDGLYPDREFGQLQWQAPDGATIPAVSRIPLAIDGAASFLRFADRLNESMQEDTSAVMLLARLPELQTPWLNDLRIAAEFAPVLGRFVTITDFIDHTNGQASPTKFDEGEYLSPYLIQSSVLKTEAPISSPAALHQQRSVLESVAAVDALYAILKPAQAQDAGTDQVEQQLNKEEATRLAFEADGDSAQQAERLTAIASQLKELADKTADRLQTLIPRVESTSKGICLINPLPWKRTALVEWPGTYQLPAASPSIEEAREQNQAIQLQVNVPAGGFAWLTECPQGESPVTLAKTKGKPLAEDLVLRNQFFEVQLSEATGGIASVTFHNQRANRVSQQVAFRYDNSKTFHVDGEEVTTSYATTQLVSSRVTHAGPMMAAIETTSQITDVVTGEVRATFRQTVSLHRNSSRLQVRIEFDDVPSEAVGNPWMTYYAARFAWEDESASITRGMLGQARGFRGERFESPDYVEVTDADSRLLIVPHGRPYHRRSGRRMLDSLLLVEGECDRRFEFTLDFNQGFPMRVASEVLSPIIQRSTENARPSNADSAWILGLSAKNVIAARIRTECAAATAGESSEKGPSTKVVLLLEETEGRATACRVLTARPPAAARVRSGTGETVQGLTVTDSGVVIDFARFQIKEVELTF